MAKSKTPVELTFHFIQRIVSDLIMLGVLSLLIALLIFLFPEFLRLFVGILLVVAAIWLFNMAYKVSKFGKIRFEI